MSDATIEKIKEVIPHPNADKLDLVKVLGFQCVVPRGAYKSGDTIAYIRPDTVLPKDQEWAQPFLKYVGNRLKAIKLRGEWSEGLVVSLNGLPGTVAFYGLGEDISELLGVYHYEPPVPQNLNAKGNLPFGIPKTDEERWENLKDENIPFGDFVDVTRKVDGQSCSFYYDLESDTFGVLGRRFELKTDCENNYTSHIERYDIERRLRNFCLENQVSLCIRGESYGQGIQKGEHNPDNKNPLSWAMFSVYNIKTHEYERKGSQFYFEDVARELGFPTVKVLAKNIVLTKDLIQFYSEGELGFEGVVINHADQTFKVINKEYDTRK